MTQQTLAGPLSRELKPVCPRDDHQMRYEAMGIRWTEGDDGPIQSLSSYHCGYFGCSVRYTPADGYFTVIDAPDVPTVLDEPGANLLRCPRHGTWLYRCKNPAPGGEFAWRCGVESCDYQHADIEASWFRP